MKWDTIKLGEVMDVKHGYAFESKFFTDSGKYVLLSPGNFHESGGLKLKGDKEKYYVGEFPTEFLLNEGDMLVVMTDLINTAPNARGAAYPAVVAADFERAEIHVLSKRLLESFDEFAEPTFSQIHNLRQQNQKLRAARDLLLPRLRSGEIAV